MSQFYGDETRWFIGMVVDNVDPLKLDRVKVRIHGIHNNNEIPTEDLPWAQVNLPVTEDGSSGLGGNSQLKNRAQVFGIFLDGTDSQLPLVLGSIPKIETERNDVNEAHNTGAGPDTIVGVTTAELTGNTNIEKCFNFFISPEGGSFTIQQACGMIGNFCVESGATMNKGDINPNAKSGFQNENSYGIAQWNPARAAGNRFGELVKFSASIGIAHTSLDAQVRFVKHELETYGYMGVGQLRKADTVEKATIVFQDKYERPNKALAHTNQRIAFAQETFKKLGIGAAI